MDAVGPLPLYSFVTTLIKITYYLAKQQLKVHIFFDPIIYESIEIIPSFVSGLVMAFLT